MTIERHFTLDAPQMIDLQESFNTSVAELSRQIIHYEEQFIRTAIALAGYEPITSADAEWMRHVRLRWDGNGRKTILVDGVPRWRIITELAPWSGLRDYHMIIDHRYMVRMFQVPALEVIK